MLDTNIAFSVLCKSCQSCFVENVYAQTILYLRMTEEIDLIVDTQKACHFRLMGQRFKVGPCTPLLSLVKLREYYCESPGVTLK